MAIMGRIMLVSLLAKSLEIVLLMSLILALATVPMEHMPKVALAWLIVLLAIMLTPSPIYALLHAHLPHITVAPRPTLVFNSAP